MNNDLNQKIIEAYENLPENVSDIIYNLNVEDTATNIFSKYSIDEFSSQEIQASINLVLINVLSPDDFVEKISSMFSNKPDLLDNLLGDINNEIFLPFSEKIDLLIQEEEGEAGPEKSEEKFNSHDTYHEKIDEQDSNVVEALLHPKKTTDILPKSKSFFDVINKEKDEIRAKEELLAQEKAKEEQASALASSVVQKTNFGYNPSPIIEGNNVNLKGTISPIKNVPNLTKINPSKIPETTNTTDLRNTEVKRIYHEIPEKLSTVKKTNFEFNKIEELAGVKIPEPPTPGKTLRPEPQKSVGGYVKKEFRIEDEAKKGIAVPANEDVANNNIPRAKNQEAIDMLSQYFIGKKDLNSKSTQPNQSLQFIKNQSSKTLGQIPKAPQANQNTQTTNDNKDSKAGDIYREQI